MSPPPVPGDALARTTPGAAPRSASAPDPTVGVTPAPGAGAAPAPGVGVLPPARGRAAVPVGRGLAGVPGWLPVLLGVLTAVGPVSTDMYLPAFPAMEQSLGGAAGSAQITLATWFAGLAVGQMTQGTLSDRYGRRVPLLVGTAIYTLASAGCALAGDMWTLSAWRAVAAFGGSASMVVPRAVVRDLADGHEAARLMSRLMLVMGAVPILAPTLGGLVLGFAGWRTIFWIATVYGVLCLVVVAARLPDTLAPERRVRLRPTALLARYISVARERTFLTHAAMAGCGSFTMFAYLGGSPPVFIDLFHLSPTAFGVVFMGTASAFITASQLNPLLLRRFGHGRVLRTASMALLCATGLLVLVAASGVGGLPALVLAVMLSFGSMGLIMPNTAVGALSRHAAQAGAASALLGTLQFLLGAVSGTAIGLLGDGTARPLAGMMLLGAVGLLVADRLRPRRD